MNSVENAIVIPFILLLITVMIVISVKNVSIIEKQVSSYSVSNTEKVSNCNVLRITEVICDEIKEHL